MQRSFAYLQMRPEARQGILGGGANALQSQRLRELTRGPSTRAEALAQDDCELKEMEYKLLGLHRKDLAEKWGA
jgi:hypothetical protein